MGLRGITVKLIQREEAGRDEFNAPIYRELDPVFVDNVLIAPLSSQELLETVNLYGKKAVYQRSEEHTSELQSRI